MMSAGTLYTITSIYIGPPYCLAEMYTGRIACCPLVSHGEYAEGTNRQTDGRTPDHYITLSTRRGSRQRPLNNRVLAAREGGKTFEKC